MKISFIRISVALLIFVFFFFIAWQIYLSVIFYKNKNVDDTYDKPCVVWGTFEKEEICRCPKVKICRCSTKSHCTPWLLFWNNQHNKDVEILNPNSFRLY